MDRNQLVLACTAAAAGAAVGVSAFNFIAQQKTRADSQRSERDISAAKSALSSRTSRQRSTRDVIGEPKLSSSPRSTPAQRPRAPAKAEEPSYIRFEICDMNGKALSKTVPARNRGDKVMLYSGAIALGANSKIMTLPEEILGAGCPNAQLLPQWETETVLPWAGTESGATVTRVFCEQMSVRNDGSLNGAMPRSTCKRLLAKLEEKHGLKILAASELEFCVAQADDWSQPAFKGPEIFTTLQASKVEGFCIAIETAARQVGIDIRTMNCEYGDGQLEITYKPAWGIAAPDAASTFRTMVKELAQQRGMLATFLARPFGLDNAGSGGHFNFSLWRNGAVGMESALHDPAAPDGLSAEGRHFLAGVLAHAPALEALCSPTPACYTRHGTWAPTVGNHGPDDRLCAVRVKASADADPGDCYFELRMPSASACAYLVLAGIAAAGADGLERRLELPKARQTEAEGALKLPTTLLEACDALEADEVLCEALGGDQVRWYTTLKRAENAAVEQQVAAAKCETKEEETSARIEAWRTFFMEYV